MPMKWRVVTWLFFLVLNTLVLSIETAQAGQYQLWQQVDLNKSNERVFATAELEGKYWQFKVFSQIQGDYPTLSEAHSFKKIDQLKLYRSSKYPRLVEVSELADWPIVTSPHKSTTTKGLWSAKNQWSVEWEKEYAQWIQSEVGPDFFNRYGLATDCADVLVGLRWIFARNNFLPVANTIAATGNLFTHESMLRNWGGLSRNSVWYKDRLFMTALNYIMNLTSTRTLVRDAYPVAMSTQGLLAGSFILTIGSESNHAKLISENYFTDPSEIPLYTLSSTTPRSRKDMVREVMLDEEWPRRGVKDFLALRWPLKSSKGRWYLKKDEEHFNYSLEQFDEELRDEYPSFIDFLLKRLKPNFSPERIVEIGVTEIKDYLQMRELIVIQGYEYCKTRNCAHGTSAWDDWSTPSRDAKIASKFNNYEVMLARYEPTYPGLLQAWRNALKTTTFALFGEETSLSAIRYIWREQLYSSEPWDTPAKRWGLEFNSLFEEVLSELRVALSERDDIFKRAPNSCDFQSCYPKNALWLGLNTYHIDARILELNSRVRLYCHQLATSGCLKSMATILGAKIATYDAERSALDWLMLAPVLSSDPRHGLAQRWGRKEQGQVSLPVFESIKIAQNSLALIDDHLVMDLDRKIEVFKAAIGQRVYLTKRGQLLLLEAGVQGRPKIRPSVTSDWQDLPLNPIHTSYNWNAVEVQDYANGTILAVPLASDAGYLLIDFNDRGLVKEYYLKSDWYQLHDQLVTFAEKDAVLSVINLNQATISEYAYSTRDIKEPRLVKLFGDHTAYLVGQYSDQNEDLYYPVIADTTELKLKAARESFAYSKLRYFNYKHGYGVIELEFNSEFPELFAVKLVKSSFERKQLLGNLIDSISGDHLLVSKGGRWDQVFDRTLYQVGEYGIRVKEKDDATQRLVSLAGPYLLTEGIGAQQGELINLRNGEARSDLPDNLVLGHRDTPADVLMASANENILLARFNTYFGDYFGLGQIYLENDQGSVELILTNSLFLNDNDELLNDWRAKFVRFKVYSGTLVGTQVGLATWIGHKNNTL